MAEKFIPEQEAIREHIGEAAMVVVAIPEVAVVEQRQRNIEQMRSVLENDMATAGHTPTTPWNVPWLEYTDGMKSLTPTSSPPQTTQGGIHVISVIVERWKFHEKKSRLMTIVNRTRRTLSGLLRKTAEKKAAPERTVPPLPTLTTPSGEKLEHMGHIDPALFAWSEKSLDKNFLDGQWHPGGIEMLNANSAILPRGYPYPLAVDDPLWQTRLGVAPSIASDQTAFPYHINPRSAAVSDGGVEACRQYAEKILDIPGLFRDVCEIMGARPELCSSVPVVLQLGVAGNDELGGSVTMGIIGYFTRPDGHGLRLVDAQNSPPSVLTLVVNERVPLWQQQHVAGHELAHWLTPFHPDNDVIVEGVAELTASLLMSQSQRPCFSVDCSGMADLLHGSMVGYNLGDCISTKMLEPYKTMHQRVSAVALWEILDRNIENFRAFVRLMRCPTIDCTSTDAFTREVDQIIPGFRARFNAHPVTAPIVDGPRVVAINVPGGVTLMGCDVQHNPRVCYSDDPTLPLNEFGYVSRKEEFRHFDRHPGTAQPIRYRATITTASGRTVHSPEAEAQGGELYIVHQTLEEWIRATDIAPEELFDWFRVEAEIAHDDRFEPCVHSLSMRLRPPKSAALNGRKPELSSENSHTNVQ